MNDLGNCLFTFKQSDQVKWIKDHNLKKQKVQGQQGPRLEIELEHIHRLGGNSYWNTKARRIYKDPDSMHGPRHHMVKAMNEWKQRTVGRSDLVDPATGMELMTDQFWASFEILLQMAAKGWLSGKPGAEHATLPSGL
jgi:hypothetical protein